MNPGTFFAELRRRNVYKVAAGYAVVGWLVMQVAATIVPALHLPDSLTTAVVVLTLLGFPIALIIAWAFEMTPEGMKRTENVSPNEHIPQWESAKVYRLCPGRRAGRGGASWISVMAIERRLVRHRQVDRGSSLRESERGQGQRLFR